MDIEIQDIEQRLGSQFKPSQRLVFWEDPASDYEGVLDDLHVDNAMILNITNSELASKRIVLREQPDTRFVLYRSGDVPAPDDDLVYDLKLASIPFTCSMEGMWADECGISPEKAVILLDHVSFFKSKERKEALRNSLLPKETDSEIRFAMVAAIFKVKEGNTRDAVRELTKKALIEWARGESSCMSRLSESGLIGVFWKSIEEVLEYHAPESGSATIDDLAFRMLEAKCSSLIEDDLMANPAECTRILDTLANSPSTRFAYDHVVAECGAAVRMLVEDDVRTVDALSNCDALREFDEWILLGFGQSAAVGTLDLQKVEAVWSRRRHMIWSSLYKSHYESLIAAGRFRKQLNAYNKEVHAATSQKALFDSYCSDWYLVDTYYRDFHSVYKAMQPGKFKSLIEPVQESIDLDYGKFLVDLTDRWQIHLLDSGQWPPKSLSRQDAFFHDYVEMSFPRPENNKRIGVIISDALRYEAGVELSMRMGSTNKPGLKGRIKTKCQPMLCMLPSYTQLGMAALLPSGPLEINPSDMSVRASGMSTLGSDNRRKVLQARINGAEVYKATEIIDMQKGSLDDVSVAYVYHNVIDKTGDSRETETKVFSSFKDAFVEIEDMVQALLRAGCSKVYITADHGFLYQNDSPETYLYADVQNLSLLKSNEEVVCDHTRRFVIGTTLPESDSLIEYSAADLSLEGDYKIAMPKGISRLRLKGSGSRFVHGGASLQENVIPVVEVLPAKASEASHQTSAEGFPIGRSVITGPMVSINVYQTEPCSENCSPVKIKVGVYAKEGKLLSATEQMLNLSSTDLATDSRKTRVDMILTDDVDDYSKVAVRIFAQVGSTSAFKQIWEMDYSVMRAFDSDF